jgi:predicted dehydrogenase
VKYFEKFLGTTFTYVEKHMTKLKLGLIGCGNISPLYLKAAQHFENLEYLACSDLNMDAAKARAKEFNIPNVLNVDEIIHHPEIDCIVNLTVPTAHAEVAKKALNAGKHVYNEKPLAAELADAKEIVSLAKAKNLRLACAPSTFLGATVQTARQAVQERMIGEVVAANAFFMSHGMEHWHPNPESFYQKGAGPMFDIGPYYLTALVHILGSVSSVSASARISFKERTISSQPKAGQTFAVTTPTHIAGTLEFTSGAIATVITSFDVWHTQMPRFEIYGSEGTLALEAPNMFGVKVEVRKAKDETWQTLPLVSAHQDFEGSWGLALADLAWAIEESRPHKASSEQALHVLELMHAFLGSAESGKRVMIESKL